jgi:hypothetical protein
VLAFGNGARNSYLSPVKIVKVNSMKQFFCAQRASDARGPSLNTEPIRRVGDVFVFDPKTLSSAVVRLKASSRFSSWGRWSSAILVLTALFLSGPASSQSRYRSCEDGHWIDDVMDDGRLIKLEDGSLWEVDEIDTVDSALWLPASDVVVCAGRLINIDDNESVGARRVR